MISFMFPTSITNYNICLNHNILKIISQEHKKMKKHFFEHF